MHQRCAFWRDYDRPRALDDCGGCEGLGVIPTLTRDGPTRPTCRICGRSGKQAMRLGPLTDTMPPEVSGIATQYGAVGDSEATARLEAMRVESLHMPTLHAMKTVLKEIGLEGLDEFMDTIHVAVWKKLLPELQQPGAKFVLVTGVETVDPFEWKWPTFHAMKEALRDRMSEREFRAIMEGNWPQPEPPEGAENRFHRAGTDRLTVKDDYARFQKAES